MKTQSCTRMNGQYRQVRPRPQFSQAAIDLTHDTMRSRQAGTTNNSCQNWTFNTGVQPPQHAHFHFRNGAYPNRQTSNCQTSTVQTVSSQQQPAVGNTNNYYLKVLLGNVQNPTINMQSENPHLLVTSGFQAVSQQNVHQNSAQNSSSPPNIMKANTTYPQQDMSAHWNQSVRVNGNVVNAVSDLQHCGVQKSLFQNTSRERTKPVSVYTTSLSPEQVVCSRTLVSGPAHYGQTAQNNRQNSTQHAFSPSIRPPSYNTQSFRNNGITTNSSSSGQILHASLNPAAGTQQEMLRRQMAIARIADDLRKSFTAGSDDRAPVYTSSHNSNASQSLPLNSGLSLPQTANSVMSGTQHRGDMQPLLSSAPNVFYITTTGDGSGNGSKAASAFFPKSNRVSEGNLVGSLSNASPLIHLPETQTSVSNNHEILEILSSVKINDSSIHSSPGRTGTRAVAVVQPLSQESYQVAGKHTSSNTINQLAERNATDECLSNPEKFFISPTVAENKKALNLREGSNLYPENPNQMRSNKSVIIHSAASSDGTSVSSSDSARHQDLSQKLLCADDTRSINVPVDQRVTSTAQQSVTSEVPVSQSGDEDKSEKASDPKPLVVELSSIPTIPWTTDSLTKHILDTEKAQMKLKRNFTEFDSNNLLIMFWDGHSKSLACKLKTGWYRDLISDVREFCSQHVILDSVVLSQVKNSFVKQLKSYHVLKDNEVYSEPPYKSSWLNVNEQLDDIDKESGFQCPLKHRLHTLESDNDQHQVGTRNSIPVQIVSEVPNKVLSQTEPEPVDSGEEEQACTVEVASTQTDSPNITNADSSDPFYSFEIQVLSPEEAKVIFEQAQSNMPQSVDTDSQPERVKNSSVEGELPDVTLSDSKREKGSIEQICCISRWVEIIVGSKAPLTECRCKYEQSHKASTDQTPDKEEMAVQKKGKLCAIRPDSKFHSAVEGENEANGGENLSYQIMTFSQTLDFTDDNDNSDKEPKNISQISLNSSQSSIIVISENEDEDLFLSENEIPSQMPDLEMESEQAQMKLTESSQSGGSDSSEKETQTSSRSYTDIQSDPEVDNVQGQLKSTGSTLSCTLVCSDKESSSSESEENCGQAQLTFTDVAESSLETEQADISATAALQTTFSLRGINETVERKRKRLSCHDRFFPLLTKSKKCKPHVDVDLPPVLESLSKRRKVFVDATGSEPLASNVRTVELVLFGSARQVKCPLIGSRKSHISSQETVFDGVPRPPKVLTVNLSPLRRKPSETVPTGEYSVKRWIHEKWRRSLPPPKIRHRSKLKTQKGTFASLSGVSLKKAEMVGPNSTEELPVSSEMRTWNLNTKRCLSLKRKRALSNGLKRGEEKTKKYAAALKQNADRERSNAENGCKAVVSLQKNAMLRFSVLPNTFNFKDGSNGRKETNDLVPDKPDFVEGKDKSPNMSAARTRGTWCPNPEKRYCPLLSPPTPKTSLFQEFQKRYMEMTQQSTDE